ncbi:MAG TPA: hypothetical protein VEU76_08005 [Candidatus Udaeobacter sp.]|nr:hypothetical protein [Candidatus Udaeobacter sp.]
MSQTREVRTKSQAEQEDVFFGQTVIVWARWAVIVAGIVLVLWTSTDVALLSRTMPFFLVLMAINFFFHGRYVMGSPLNRTVVTAASIVDLVLITAIVIFWPNAEGFHNQFYVLYFPVVFAFALVFTRKIEVVYTVLAIAAYTGACLLTGTLAVTDGLGMKTLVMRLIVIASMGFLGNFYFRIQRDRLAKASRGDAATRHEMHAGARS